MRSEKLLLQLQSRLKRLEQALELEKEKNSKLEEEIKKLKKPKVSTKSKFKKSSMKKSEE